jgi:hypothetical protein
MTRCPDFWAANTAFDQSTVDRGFTLTPSLILNYSQILVALVVIFWPQTLGDSIRPHRDVHGASLSKHARLCPTNKMESHLETLKNPQHLNTFVTWLATLPGHTADRSQRASCCKCGSVIVRSCRVSTAERLSQGWPKCCSTFLID